MANEISNIASSCALNAKGLRRILLIEASSVLPRFFYAPNIPQPALVSGKTWKEIQFFKRSGEYTENLQHDRNHGDFYRQTLSFSLKGDSLALTIFHNLLKNRHLAALITDQNGLTKFVPKLKPQSKLIKNERLNQYDIQMTFDSSHPAPVVEGIDEGTGGGGAVDTILKSNVKLTGERYNVEGYDSRLFRTDGGNFPADGIPLGSYNLKVQLLPDPTVHFSLAEVLATEIKLVADFFAGTLPVAVVISDAAASPVFENFQYGTV